MKRGTFCPALAVCIVRLMKNMIALMVSLHVAFVVSCFSYIVLNNFSQRPLALLAYTLIH